MGPLGGVFANMKRTFFVLFLCACSGSLDVIKDSGTCTSTDSDPHNCGACGHDCLGGTCTAGACAASVGYSTTSDVPTSLAVDATYAFFTTRPYETTNIQAPLTIYRCEKKSCATTLTKFWSGDTGFNGALATDGTSVFFASWTTVYSCPTSGCATPTVIASNQSVPARIALAQDRVLWTTYAGFDGQVLACQKVGCTAPTVIASKQSNAWGIAADSKNVYWTNDVTQTFASGVFSCPLSGCPSSGPITIAASNLVNPSGIVTDGTNVYWTDSYQPDLNAYSCPISGCSGAPNLISASLVESSGVAVDADAVYVAGVANNQAALVKCAKIGCASGSTVLASGNIGSIGTVAVDDVGVYWTTYDTTHGGTVAFLAK